jgi:hypothetical protein
MLRDWEGNCNHMHDPRVFLYLEQIAAELEAGADDPELVRAKAAELRQVVGASEEILEFMGRFFEGYLKAKQDLKKEKVH